MTASTQTDRYSRAQRLLHWLTLLAITIAYVAIEVRGELPRTHTLRPLVTQLHFWAGISVFVMLLLRVWLRLTRGSPAIVPTPPLWAARFANATHLLIYLVLFAQPILGALAAAAGGKAIVVPLLGVALPALLARTEYLEHRLEDIHGEIGELFYYVIAVHVLAALWHHFVARDNTLRRMLAG